MLNKLTASTKLYLLVFVLCIFIVGTGAYGISEMRKMNQNTQTLYADRVIPLEQLTTVRYAYAIGILNAAQQAKTGQITFRQAKEQVLEAERKIRANWKAYMLTYLTADEQQLAKQTNILISQLNETVKKLQNILDKNDARSLENFINRDLYPFVNPAISKLTELINLQVRISDEIHKNSINTYNTSLKKFLLLIILSLAFAVPFSYYLVRNVKDLIKNLRISNAKITVSEEKYRSLFEHAGDAIFVVNNDLAVVDINTSAFKLLGYSKEEYAGRKFFEFFNPEELEKRPMQLDLLRKEKALATERKLIRKDGTEIDADFNIKVLDDKGYLVIARDITGQKQIQDALLLSEKKYRTIFENVQDVFYQTNLAGVILDVSPSIKNHIGYSRDELIGTSSLNLFYDPADRETALKLLWEKGEIKDYELHFKSNKGELVYISLNAVLIYDANGNPSHQDGSFRNITERKKAEEKLKQSEARLKEAQAIALLGNWEIDMVNNIHIWSDEFYAIFGINKDQVQPSTEALLSFMHPDDVEQAKEEIKEAFITFNDSNSSFRFFRKDGTIRFAYIEWRFEFDKNNHPTRLYGILQDITERKKAEESIKQSEANYRQLFNLSPAPMWVLDAETQKFIQVNKACMNTYGYSDEEFTNMTIADIIPQDNETDKKNTASGKKQATSFFKGGQHIKKSGEIMDVETSSIPVVVNGKKQILVIAIDVTEKNRYEQKLTRAAIKAQEDERYEIGGELHDNVCQILATSQIYLGLIESSLPEASKLFYTQTRQYITLASDEIRNLSHRLAPAFFDDATLEDAFKNLLKNFNIENKYQVKLYFDEYSKSHTLSRDLQLNLYRILQEQLRNILKYANAENIDIEVTLTNNLLQMKIADNGVGFDTESIKEGIGLANMSRRAQLFSGNFSVHSSVGNGCRILVKIPVSAES